MKRYIIHDTLEAFLTDLSTGKTYFFGWTTEGNIERTVAQEPIKAGIYNKVVGILQSDDGMEFSVTTGVHYEEVMEIQMGSNFVPLSEMTIQAVTEDETGTFTAKEEAVTGQVMDLNAENLPKNYKVQLRTIAYDPDTNNEVADVYWIFDKATPDGNLSEVFSAGENKVQEVNFLGQVPIGSNSYGKYVVVPREEAVEGEEEGA